jgi:GGDEF domain-containing protein
VVGVTFLLIGVYGGVLAYLTARTVHLADRWQIESAEQAGKLLGGDGRRVLPSVSPTGELSHPIPLAEAIAQTQMVAGPPSHDSVQRSFYRTRFLLRLQEDVLRARREGHEMTVIALDVNLPHGEATPEQLERLNFEIARLSVHHGQVLTSAHSVSDTEFVFGLADSDKRAAKAFLSKVVQAMGDYWCHYGIATYPEDGTDAQTLFDYALRNCDESRHASNGRGTKISANS